MKWPIRLSLVEIRVKRPYEEGTFSRKDVTSPPAEILKMGNWGPRRTNSKLRPSETIADERTMSINVLDGPGNGLTWDSLGSLKSLESLCISSFISKIRFNCPFDLRRATIGSPVDSFAP